MTGQPGANAHPQETSVRLRKGVPSGGHNLMAGHMAGSSLRCCTVNNLHNCTC